MKRLLFFLFVNLVCFTSDECFGQIPSNIVRDAITINGLHVGSKYTLSEFVNALGGKPTKVVPPSPDDEYPNAYKIYYGRDLFYLFDGQFYGFEIHTPAFRVNNLVLVGDHASVVETLGGFKEYRKTDLVKLIEWAPSIDYLYAWASVRFYYDDKGIITDILCFIYD